VPEDISEGGSAYPAVELSGRCGGSQGQNLLPRREETTTVKPATYPNQARVRLSLPNVKKRFKLFRTCKVNIENLSQLSSFSTKPY
jgi:hypothetical protein